MNRMSKRAIWMLGLSLWMGVAIAQAAPIVTDDFSYVGALTHNGWVAYSGADGSITADGSVASIGSGAEDIRLSFTDQGTGPTYASFTLNVASLPTSGGEYTFGFVDGSTMESRFGILSVGGTAFRLTGYGTRSTLLVTNSTDLAFNTDYQVTILFNGVDDHRLWIDATTNDVDSPAIQVSGANAGIDGIFIRQAGALDLGASSWTMGDLVIATTFDEVLSAEPPGVTTNVKFSASSDSIAEDGAGTYQVTVVKSPDSGDVSGEITLGGSATIGDDYTINTTNFTMNGATTSATFTITIINDTDEELSEAVTLGIVNVTGASVIAPNQFTLNITDDDTSVPTGILFSQYTETDVGTTPKGVEVWNNTGADIDFDGTLNKLEIKVGTGGGSPNSAIIITNGSLANGAVIVIGTTDMSPDYEEPFSFNGDDSVVLEFGGFVVDVIGMVGNDPGTAWTSNGVSTVNQNIQLKSGITTGDADGWLDPSERFETVSIGSILTGFGAAPGAAPTTNVSFSIAADTADESAGTYDVVIVKNLAEGDISGEIQLGGTAMEGDDYFISATNFTMNGAVTSATITITIVDDGDDEVNPTVVLTLANVTGGSVGSPSAFTLTILDNDIPPPPAGAIAYYTFTGNSAAAEYVTANATASNVTMSAGSFTFGTSSAAEWTGSSIPYANASSGWTNETDQALAKHYLVSVETAEGYVMTITNISLLYRATTAGPPDVGLALNDNNLIAVGTVENVTTSMSVEVTGYVNITSAVIKIQGWNGGSRISTGSGDFRVDDILVQGSVALGGGPVDPPTPAQETIGSATVAGGNVTVVLGGSDTNFLYAFQYRTNLVSGNWTVLTTSNGTGSAISFTDSAPADASRAYSVEAYFDDTP